MSTARRTISGLLLALLAGAAGAQSAGAPVNEALLVTEHSHLDKGQPAWEAVTLQVSRTWTVRQRMEAEITRTRRFGLDDTEVAVAGSLPLGEQLTGNLRLTHSSTHRVLARDSAAASLQWAAGSGWVLHGGAKHTRYDATDVDQLTLMLERYLGDFSAAAVVHGSRAFGKDTNAYELRSTWYYAERSSLGIYLGAGDEAAQIGPGRVALARVRSVALAGRHQLANRWTLHYGLHRVHQGDFHTRTGANLGVQVPF